MIRLCLSIGGFKFEDIRLSEEDYNKKYEQGYFKFGYVPVIELEGKQYAQSSAIGIYVAKMAHLYPTSDIGMLKHEEAMGVIKDLDDKVSLAYQQKDVKKKAQFIQRLVDEDIPFWLSQLEKLMAQNGERGYIVEDSLSLVDI